MNFKFFNNEGCKYRPCHTITGGESEAVRITNRLKKDDEINCLFCYCPLYAMGDKCGGDFVYGENGIKDCMGCTLPHHEENYDLIIDKLVEWNPGKC